jgi:hypothetical protein
MAANQCTKLEVAQSSKEFLDGILKLSQEKRIGSELTVNLFGYYCRHLVVLLEGGGLTRQQALSAVLERFTFGLGVKTVFDDGPDDTPSGPLQ